MTHSSAPDATARRTPVGSVVMLFLGSVLVLLGFWSAAGLAAAASATAARGSGGFLGSPSTLFATESYALTTPRTAELAGDRQIPKLPFELGQVRLRAEGEKPLFLGIATQADVDRYLDGVHRTEVTEVRYRPFRAEYRDLPGTREPGEPGAQDIWVASSSGSGPREITWAIQPGNWAVVVMNADGGPAVSARIEAGFRSDLLASFALAVVAAAIALLLAGLPLLIAGAVGIGRSLSAVTGSRSALPTSATADGPSSRPVRLVGRREEPLSRWLWLVKWLLAIPHYVVLALLWVAFLVTTIVAGFAILFTGRYPRSLFAFNVAVLRWSWRVGFYAYSALGTDRYPPFAFERVPYPADLEVDHPERLSRGLVLVKWWLLAIPHYLVLAALTGGAVVAPALLPWFRPFGIGSDANPGISVLGALVLIAGVLLLFTARYPNGLFDLVLGVDRWAYRVAAYAALMRDEYPPFRLDQGPDEPIEEAAAPASRGRSISL